MLFFKQIKDEKLSDQMFESFYKQECHICSATLKVIAVLETKAGSANDILNTLKISQKDYNALKAGDICHPEQVLMLCRYLGIEEIEQVKNCKRL